jgi:hypothetical protein
MIKPAIDTVTTLDFFLSLVSMSMVGGSESGGSVRSTDIHVDCS